MRKRFPGIFILGLMLTGMMWAQTAPAPAAGGRRPVTGARMFQGLNLSEDQRAKAQTILQGERSQMLSLRGDATLNDAQRRQQIQALRKSSHEQLLAVLTPEQQARIKQLQRQRIGRRAAFNAGRRFQALNLTDQQKTQLRPVFQSTRQQMLALRSDTSLTPQQRREKMQQIRQNQMAQVKSILTPEQQQQMQQWRGRRFHHGAGKPATSPNS